MAYADNGPFLNDYSRNDFEYQDIDEKVMKILKDSAESILSEDEQKAFAKSGAIPLIAKLSRDIASSLAENIGDTYLSHINYMKDYIIENLHQIARECKISLDLLSRGLIYYGNISDNTFPYNIQGKIQITMGNLI